MDENELQPSTSDTPYTRVLQDAAERLLLAKSRDILLIEDTAAHAAIVRRSLCAKDWEMEHVTRAAEALDTFERDPNRIVLLDLSLPDCDGLELLVKLRAFNPSAAVIVVTATDAVKVSVEAMQKGAWDYVVKENPEEMVEQLLTSVERAWQGRMRSAENFLLEQTKTLELVRAQRLEAIELVVRTVCHEVNNPLSGVVALSQMLTQNPKLDGDIKKLADSLAQSAEEVREVVGKLRSIGDNIVEFGGKQILDLSEAKNTPDTR